MAAAEFFRGLLVTALAEDELLAEVTVPATPRGPAAVANAVEDALAHLGVVVRSLPITPEQVWRWLSAAKPAGSGEP